MEIYQAIREEITIESDITINYNPKSLPNINYSLDLISLRPNLGHILVEASNSYKFWKLN